MAIQIGRLIKRYCLVTLIPAFVASTTYADWSYTQQCKFRARRHQESNNDLEL